MNINELKKIRKQIDSINKLHHSKLFLIIKKYNMQYSENKNGIFINMNNLSDKCINDIKEYLIYIEKQEKTFTNMEEKKNKFKKVFFENTVENTVKNTVENTVKNTVENTVENNIKKKKHKKGEKELLQII